MFNISQNSTLVQVEFQVSASSIEYGQYLVLNLTYDKVATVQYGSIVTYPVEKKVYVSLSDLFKVHNSSSIFIRFTKELSETVYIDYYMERSVNDIGTSIKMRRGTLEIQEPDIRPDYLTLTISQKGSEGGQLSFENSSALLEGALLNVMNQEYPLRLIFSGEGTIMVYPVYNYLSGGEFSMLVDRPIKFGLKYSKNLIPGLKLSHLHVYSNNEAVDKNANMDVNVRMLNGETFNIVNFNQLSQVASKTSFDDSVSSVTNYFYFDIDGDFGAMMLGLELIEIYDVTPINKDSFTLKYSTSSSFVALLNFTEFVSNSHGLAIKTDGLSGFYIDSSVPTNFKKEEAMWMTDSETSDVFGFSEYSNNELMEIGSVYLRIEPTDQTSQTRNLGSTSGQFIVAAIPEE